MVLENDQLPDSHDDEKDSSLPADTNDCLIRAEKVVRHLFGDGTGMKGFTHAISFDDAKAIIKAMNITRQSSVLEFG